jgi:hypothetical protein
MRSSKGSRVKNTTPLFGVFVNCSGFRPGERDLVGHAVHALRDRRHLLQRRHRCARARRPPAVFTPGDQIQLVLHRDEAGRHA